MVCYRYTYQESAFCKVWRKNPTDRGKRGIKQSLIVDRKGAPLFVDVAPANKNDSRIFKKAVSKMRKSKQVRIMAADSAFDVKDLRSYAKSKNIALIAAPNKRRNKTKHKFNIPHRWIVEQAFGILAWFRGLKVCWSKTLISARAALQIACSLRIFKMCGISDKLKVKLIPSVVNQSSTDILKNR